MSLPPSDQYHHAPVLPEQVVPTPWEQDQVHGGRRPLVIPGTRVYTPAVWLLVFSPIAFLAVTNFLPGMPDPFLQGASLLDPAFAILAFLRIAALFFLSGLGALLAYQDWRSLKRSGVLRPFHWAWAFLGPYAYVIGRSVIVNKVAPKRGLAPVWTMIGIWLISMAATSFMFLSSPTFQALMGSVALESTPAAASGSSPSSVPEPTTTTPSPEVKEFTDTLNGFSVSFAGKPKSWRYDVPVGDGTTIQRDSFSTETATSSQYVTIDPMECIVAAEDHAKGLQVMLEELVAGSGKAGEGTSSIDSRQIIELQSFPAIKAAITHTDDDGTKSKGMVLMVFRGPTIITVAATSQGTEGEEVRFVDSFRFLERAAVEGPTCDLSGVPATP